MSGQTASAEARSARARKTHPDQDFCRERSAQTPATVPTSGPGTLVGPPADRAGQGVDAQGSNTAMRAADGP